MPPPPSSQEQMALVPALQASENSSSQEQMALVPISPENVCIHPRSLDYTFRKTEERRRLSRILAKKIQGSMFMDGLFSEAVNAETGECTSKAWFSWPGCVISSALIKFEILGEKAWDHEG